MEAANARSRGAALPTASPVAGVRVTVAVRGGDDAEEAALLRLKDWMSCGQLVSLLASPTTAAGRIDALRFPDSAASQIKDWQLGQAASAVADRLQSLRLARAEVAGVDADTRVVTLKLVWAENGEPPKPIFHPSLLVAGEGVTLFGTPGVSLLLFQRYRDFTTAPVVAAAEGRADAPAPAPAAVGAAPPLNQPHRCWRGGLRCGDEVTVACGDSEWDIAVVADVPQGGAHIGVVAWNYEAAGDMDTGGGGVAGAGEGGREELKLWDAPLSDVTHRFSLLRTLLDETSPPGFPMCDAHEPPRFRFRAARWAFPRVPPPLPQPLGALKQRHQQAFTPTASQESVLDCVAGARLSCVWGPPGSGKTYVSASVVATLLAAAHEASRPFRVLLVAQTKKAAELLLKKSEGMLRKMGCRPPQEEGGGSPTASASSPHAHASFVAVASTDKESRFYDKAAARVLATRPRCVLAATVYQCAKQLRVYPDGSASPLPKFDLVLVDEASQLLACDALLALDLLHPARGRLVVVGDHAQLPPIVKLDVAVATPCVEDGHAGGAPFFSAPWGSLLDALRCALLREGAAPLAEGAAFSAAAVSCAASRVAAHLRGCTLLDNHRSCAPLLALVSSDKGPYAGLGIAACDRPPLGRACGCRTVLHDVPRGSDDTTLGGGGGRLQLNLPPPGSPRFVPWIDEALRPEHALVVIRLPPPPSRPATDAAAAAVDEAWVAATLLTAAEAAWPCPPAGGPSQGGGAAVAAEEARRLDAFLLATAVVAPHHRQAAALRRALRGSRLLRAQPQPPAVPPPPALRCDTVEKMQGQEAELVVVMYGLGGGAEALAAEASFLFCPKRVNVATSRARLKMIVILSDDVLGAEEAGGGGGGATAAAAAAAAAVEEGAAALRRVLAAAADGRPGCWLINLPPDRGLLMAAQPGGAPGGGGDGRDPGNDSLNRFSQPMLDSLPREDEADEDMDEEAGGEAAAGGDGAEAMDVAFDAPSPSGGAADGATLSDTDGGPGTGHALDLPPPSVSDGGAGADGEPSSETEGDPSPGFHPAPPPHAPKRGGGHGGGGGGAGPAVQPTPAPPPKEEPIIVSSDDDDTMMGSHERVAAAPPPRRLPPLPPPPLPAGGWVARPPHGSHSAPRPQQAPPGARQLHGLASPAAGGGAAAAAAPRSEPSARPPGAGADFPFCACKASTKVFLHGESKQGTKPCDRPTSSSSPPCQVRHSSSCGSQSQAGTKRCSCGHRLYAKNMNPPQHCVCDACKAPTTAQRSLQPQFGR